MKKTATYLFSILLLMTFISCNDSELWEQSAADLQKRVLVTLDTSVPLASIPSGRAITDDSAINDYAIWVFSDGKFVDALYMGDTYQEDDQLYPMVDLKSNGNLYLLLPEGLQNVTLAMVANVNNIKVNEPAVGASIEEANVTFDDNNHSGMPMYGITSTPFNVALGAKGGTIVLHRAMAKVEVHAAGASDHFKLEEMYVYQTNTKGTVKEISTIKNDAPMLDKLSGSVVTMDNSGYVYLPEINLKAMGENPSFVILKGEYTFSDGRTKKDRWYKLAFIRQTVSDDRIDYLPLETIKRNYRYIFDIQYLTEGTGYENLEDAINGDASNKIVNGSTSLITIDDMGIMDITTNNYIYLGVTAGEVATTEGNSYHVANVSIVTNSDKGWKFESLPNGVDVSISECPKDNNGNYTSEVTSVWVYLNKGQYSKGDDVTLYVYGENIRKSITIKVS